MHPAARSVRDLDSDARDRLARTLLRRGARQLGVLRATGAAIASAPSMDDCAGSIERAREELLHLEHAAELYAEATGADLLLDAECLIGELPSPSGWLEAVLAQLMLCLAAQVELETASDVHLDLEPSARKALARETEHVNAARAALHEARAFSSEMREHLRESTARWLPVALGTLEDDLTRERYTRELERTALPIQLHLSH
jgi:hypothetical protein